MKRQVLFAIPLAIASMSTATAKSPTFSPWEGASARIGQGGAKETVDGVDLWTMGDPPRPYHVLGLITREHGGDGIGKRSELAKLGKEHDGDAGIITSANTTSQGGFAVTPTLIATVKSTTVQVLVIKYDLP
jgi:hypothetical protein